jgi:hypothetical protein
MRRASQGSAKKFAFPCLCFFLILGSAFYSFNPEEALAAPLAGGKTLVLYDADSGTVPGTPLMSFTDFPPGAAQPAYSNGATVLDTTTAGQDTYAGWTSNGTTTPGFPNLDRTAGFQVDFTLQIENESHSNHNRSGFSLILLSEDARGIEIAFWENEIWAQSDSNTGALFQRGESVSFQTTIGLIDYRLTVSDDTYTLTANTQSILTGPLRDYSEFDGFPDPYQTPNFLFLGDDTTSAQARVRLRFVSITGTEPVIPTGTSTGISTSTSSPLPTASPTPLPSLTPISTSTPTGKAFESCPSSLVLLAVIMTNAMLRKGVRAKSKIRCQIAYTEPTVDKNRLLYPHGHKLCLLLSRKRNLPAPNAGTRVTGGII